MLVLDRKIQEGFWIEDKIFVKVLSIGRRRIKLGIEAPEEYKIVREELWSRPPDETSGERARSESGEQDQAGGSFRSVRRRN